jgi:hypothetical protein
MMATTVARLAGLIYNDMVDTIWEPFWTLTSGEVGVFLATATACRSFYVSRKNRKAYSPKQEAQRFFSASFAAKFNRKKKNTLDDTLATEKERNVFGLPTVPRAHMTGVRTFINEQGEVQPVSASSLESTIYSTEDDLARLHSLASSKEPIVVIRDV